MIFEINESKELFITGVLAARPLIGKYYYRLWIENPVLHLGGVKFRGVIPGLAVVYRILCRSRYQLINILQGGFVATIPSLTLLSSCGHLLPPSLPLLSLCFLFECTTDGTDAWSRARGRSSFRCQCAPLRAEYSRLHCAPQEKSPLARRHVLNECVSAK